MIFYPNAKINIGLNILSKRADGYHELSSIFYPVKDLYDILEVIPADNFSFSRSGISIPGEENICTKAFELLKADFGIGNVKIHLHKLIPVGAGLGGGSSDGAFMLKALNELFNLRISKDRLERYSLQLGADCPFFIDNRPKYVTGIGDEMSEIDLSLGKYKLKFIFPGLHISTSEAYAFVKPRIPRINLLELIKQPINNWKDNVRNDFEDAAFAKYPELAKMKENFYSEGAIYSSMTGSGSVIYKIQ